MIVLAATGVELNYLYGIVFTIRSDFTKRVVIRSMTFFKTPNTANKFIQT